MKKYFVNCRDDRVEYFEITGETEGGFFVRITRIRDGSKKVLEEKISRDLFDICLRTGYIYKAGEKPAQKLHSKAA